METQIPEIVTRGHLEGRWDYRMLKHFSSYPDMRFKLFERDEANVRKMLEQFETGARHSAS
jgi:hypothetical protein